MPHRVALAIRRALIPLFALTGFIVSSCSPDGQEPTGPGSDPALSLQGGPPGLAKALAVQAKHTDRLLKVAGVVGTAVGLGTDGQAELRLLTKTPGLRGLPASLDGVRVSVVVTGEIRAIPAAAPTQPLAGGVNTTNRLARPVPIGVSTGNAGECSSGTIGARVKSGTTTYALSNNHVYALENRAAIGSKVLQPGRYDLNCAAGGANEFLGTLSKFVTINFSTTANNRVDAAIAVASTANLGRSTPSNGYGTPRATTVAAALNQTVQKYGRTTELTTGSVVGLNTTVNISYSRGTARFVGQILIKGKGQFSRAGDSGSLIVDSSRRPVGLLFAGSSNGYTIANQIGNVLSALGVSIDGN